MVHFTLAPLRQDQVRESYPLIRTAAPGASLDRWQHFASVASGEPRGALVLTTEDGTIHGVATYQIEEDLTLGRVLVVDHLVSFELSRAAPARRALCEGLERRARDAGCVALRVSTMNRALAAADFSGCETWKALGYVPSGVAFEKRLAPDAETADGEARN